jgi:hypothetical protein
VWYTPYYDALENIGSDYSDDFLNNIQGVATLEDLLRAYIHVADSLDEGVSLDINTLLSLVNSDMTITREAFAAITQMFAVQMYQ